MNKPPVSILQELMAKKRIIPQYILIYNGAGTQNVTFTYQVSCDGIVKTGTGRSKKDAKHNAAKAVLETILAEKKCERQISSGPCKRKLPVTEEESVIAKKAGDPSSLNIPDALQQICICNNLPTPDYKFERHGSPEAWIFTAKCTVSSFNEEASAASLKEAENEAARKVWAKLQINFEKLKKQKNEDERFHILVRSAETLLHSFTPGKLQMPEKQNEEKNLSSAKVGDALETGRKLPFLDTVEVLNKMCNDINLPKPIYEYIAYGPSNDETYTAKCIVSSFKKKGVGKMRRLAKREAARKMIEKIQSTVRKLQTSDKLDLNSKEAKFFVKGTVMGMLETIADNCENTDSQKQNFKNDNSSDKKGKSGSRNSVHALTKLCSENNLPEPYFKIKEEKFFYPRNYTVTCFVSTFKEESMSTIIEEAKHEAANKMLDKFQQSQNLYVEQLKNEVEKLDYKNPLRWKSQQKVEL